MQKGIAAAAAALLVLAASPAAATTYLFEIPGTITTTSSASGPFQVGDPVSLTSQVSDPWVVQWGDFGYWVAGSMDAFGGGASLPITGQEYWRIDAGGFTWDARSYLYDFTFIYYAGSETIPPSFGQGPLLAGPAIIFTETAVLGLANVQQYPFAPRGVPSFTASGHIPSLSQPGAFHPLTYGASAFSISHNGYTLYDGQRATGVWDFANATVTVLNTAPVPEPSAWALMIAGFGLTGAMLRRVRRQGRLLAASDERRR